MGKIHRVKLDGARWAVWYLEEFKKNILEAARKSVLEDEGKKLVYELRAYIDKRQKQLNDDIENYTKALEEFENRRAKKRNSGIEKTRSSNT
ncbi:MAG: hypothetical protein AAGC43_04510 [Bacteroidota bacterium]